METIQNLRHLELPALRIFARSADGPFSYLTFKGFRMTVLKAVFDENSNLVIISKTADKYLEEFVFNDKVKELTLKVRQRLMQSTFDELMLFEENINNLFAILKLTASRSDESENQNDGEING